MRRVSEIRRSLEAIPGALREAPEREWRARGDVRVLQEEVDASGYSDLIFRPDDDTLESPVSGDPPFHVELPPDIETSTQPLISTDEAKEIAAAVQVNGVDALGWYVTFHQRSAQWGVYLSQSGVAFMAEHIFAPTGIGKSRSILLAVHAIIRHELTHFAADYMAAQWELALGKPCYWPARSLKDPNLGYNVMEEKLANGHMLRAFRYPSSATKAPNAYQALRRWTRTLPRGYSEGLELIPATAFQNALAQLAGAYESRVDRSYHPPPGSFDHSALYPSFAPFDYRFCPIFLVADGKTVRIPSFAIQLIPCIPDLKESKRFRKSLRAMHPNVQRAWAKTRSQLAQTTGLKSLNFKRWPDRRGGLDLYSVRVDSSVRAHLRCRDYASTWIAEDIGAHTAMGHG
jgi:hypothetical protein